MAQSGCSGLVGGSLLIELAGVVAGEKSEAAELAARAVTGMVSLRAHKVTALALGSPYEPRL